MKVDKDKIELVELSAIIVDIDGQNKENKR